MSKVKCEHCGRRVPVVDGKLVEHWVSGWFGRNIILVGDRLCIRSGTSAKWMEELLERERNVY